jgi:glycine/D-amino acid oxidase-like deaminating enzyme
MIRLSRRALLVSAGALAGCTTVDRYGRPPAPDAVPALVPIRAETDRIFDIAVCLRPFRAAGPRLDVERIGDTMVVHNYGHGGSGWSLSWGSGAVAVRKAMAGSPREVAVIGCGILGLTAAILAQRAGAKATIYARELLPETPSARATGAWTPDSRIALADAAPPDFADLWEEMARTAFKAHRNYLGLPGDPVEWTDFYSVSSDEPAPRSSNSAATVPDLDFAEYRRRIADLIPKPRRLAADAAPFRASAVYRSENMIFNISDYGHTLLNDFFIAGGKFRYADFHSPADIAALGKSVAINCTGYGARALWKDETVTPVRGQIARLIPQPGVHYGLSYRHVYVVPRRDGIVVQDLTGGEMKGFGDTNEAVDRAEADGAVTTLAGLFSPPLWRGGVPAAAAGSSEVS